MSGDDRGGGVPLSFIGVGLLLVFLVGVNLAMTVFAKQVPDVLSSERVEALSFWGGWCAAVGACVAGLWWTGRALERSDRESTRRLRTCFVLALCVVLLLALATFEESLARPQLAAVAATLMAFLVLPFAMSARALAIGSARHRRRRREPDESS